MPAADELHRLAEDRIVAARHPDPSTGPVAAISLYGLAWCLTAPVAVAVALWAGPPSGWNDAGTWVALCAAGLPAASAAAGAALTAILRRRVLTGLWIAVAFLPWAACALGAAFVMFAVAV